MANSVTVPRLILNILMVRSHVALSGLLLLVLVCAPVPGGSRIQAAALPPPPRIASVPASNPEIFVSNPCSNEVTAYPIGSSGNAPSLSPVTGLAGPAGIAIDSSGKIYVANPDCVSVTVYASGAKGVAAPIATISGPDTGLTNPAGVALDSIGNIYVVNSELLVLPGQRKIPASITVYSPGSTGDARPMATIAGPSTGLSQPGGIAVDSGGNISVADSATDAVTVYQPGSEGDAAPVATIAGAHTGLDAPQAIASDSQGDIYVANHGTPNPLGSASKGTVTIYALGSTGDARPLATIAGFATGLDGPAGIAVDSGGDIYVANLYVANLATPTFASGAVTVYPPRSSGNVAPATIISGSKTGLDSGVRPLFGIAVDSKRDIYVANGGNNSITSYSTGAKGNASPSATISDPSTGLHTPVGIALDSGGRLYVASHDLRFNSITIYAAGSNARTAPVATLSGRNTGLNLPAGIALDSRGNIYVANMGAAVIESIDHSRIGRSPITRYSPVVRRSMVVSPFSSSVTVYSHSSNGNVKPIAMINGPKTGLGLPSGIALDSKGNMYVANSQLFSGRAPSITVYTAGSNANAKPIATIAGSDTELDGPTGIALDSSGNIYVANFGRGAGPPPNAVTVYAHGSDGNVRPTAVIAGPDTGLESPAGIALDSKGKIYVANEIHNGLPPANTITVYPPGSDGDVKPIATISGPDTGLAEPIAIAVGP